MEETNNNEFGEFMNSTFNIGYLPNVPDGYYIMGEFVGDIPTVFNLEKGFLHNDPFDFKSGTPFTVDILSVPLPPRSIGVIHAEKNHLNYIELNSN